MCASHLLSMDSGQVVYEQILDSCSLKNTHTHVIIKDVDLHFRQISCRFLKQLAAKV